MTLWSIARSPLILGGNLTKLDEFTKVADHQSGDPGSDQTGHGADPLESLPPEFMHVKVWTTSQRTGKAERRILAVFNLAHSPVTLHATWKQLGLDGASHRARSLWDDTALADSERLNVTLPAHGTTVWRLDCNVPPRQSKPARRRKRTRKNGLPHGPF